MIQINNIYKSYGELNVLNGISFTVFDGEVFGLVGGNSTGKTTLLNVIAGIDRGDTGNIRVSGKDIRAIHTTPNVIGYCQDASVVFPYMTVKEYMEYLSKCANLSKEHMESRIKKLVAMFEIEQHFLKRVSDLSRGMKQRVSIAATLLGDPLVVVMDEPTTALDQEAKDNLSFVFNKLKKSGKSIIMSTHSLWDIETYCDRVGYLTGGRLKFDMEVEKIKENIVPRVEISGSEDELQCLFDYYANKGVEVERQEGKLLIASSETMDVNQIAKDIQSQQIAVSIKKDLPSFKEVFNREVGK